MVGVESARRHAPCSGENQAIKEEVDFFHLSSQLLRLPSCFRYVLLPVLLLSFAQ